MPVDSEPLPTFSSGFAHSSRHELSNGSRALDRRACGSIDLKVVCSFVCRMFKLLAGHPGASILTSLFSCLQHRNRSPDTHDTDRSRRQRAQTGIERNGISQYEIENNLEIGVDDAP